MEAIVRTQKVGGSIMVRIPAMLVEEEGIQVKDVVRIEIEKVRKDWFGAFRGIGSLTKEDKLDTHE